MSARQEREQQQMIQAILGKAEELFCALGVENTSMDRLAQESEYTKRTIYRYFTSKEDVFFAVALSGYTRMLDSMDASIAKGRTGFEKVEAACRCYRAFALEQPALYAMMNASSGVKRTAPDANTPYQARLAAQTTALFDKMTGLFTLGIADGSIRSDRIPVELSFLMIFLVSGFFNMLSVAQPEYLSCLGLKTSAFSESAIRLLMDSLRST